ncbi:family 16 glycoside hydrolase [Paenibacillus senegalimassiliensis]|uniref:family 16 glycoside hydrolase n=1 Tax=Paenibacillus senegalimassiliensis TaxID=1737426 RepID=UPI00073EE608|nr:family 16 glycoside hydrolase [Paenibacillus senegalimassiliensis]
MFNRKAFTLLLLFAVFISGLLPQMASANMLAENHTIISIDEEGLAEMDAGGEVIVNDPLPISEDEPILVAEPEPSPEALEEASVTDAVYLEALDPAAFEITDLAATIQNYPMPSIYTASSVFSLKANGNSVPVIAYVSDYDYAQFSFSGTVTLEVTASENIDSYSISPMAKNIQGTVSGKKLTFTLSSSTYVIVKINDLKKIVIAADPLETDIPASSGPGIYNVTQSPYNADRTGNTMATTAIQRAIDDANQAGGGTVFVPAGVYKSGNLTLKSNVTFYLAGGAVIVGTGKGEDYANDFRKDSLNRDGTYFIRTAINSSNITLRGRGTIDGKGMEMRDRKMPAPHKNEGFINNLLVPLATSHFTFDGLILRDAGFWSFMVVRSDHVTITNLKGFQDLHKLENDVIDINESQDVLVKHAIAISDDDTYSTKTWLQTGMSKGWPGQLEHLENVVFDDAFAWTRCAAFKIGMGVAQPQIGVTVRNSYVYQSARALLIDHGYQYNTLPEEGYAQNITFENIDIERVGINQFGNYWLGVSTSTSGDISNVIVKDINIRELGSQNSRLSGNATKGGMVDGVMFSDVVVKGELATQLSDMKITVNSNVNGVIFANSRPPLFSDNFEDGDSAGWTAHSGSWSIAKDDTKVLAQNATATSLITAGSSWTDYAYEAKVKMPINNANAGIVFRVKDTNNYYMYRINATAQEVELYKSINGTLTKVSNASFAAVAKRWYTLKVVVQGNTIEGYVDGALKTEWTNPVTELTSGKIGFRTTSADVLFDNAVVSSLNKAPTNLTLSHNQVPEHTTAGGSVGTFTTTDPDEGDTFIYQLVAGAGDSNNGSFNISGNALILKITPDYETKTSYSIRVRTVDSGGLYYEKAFTIQITDVNETPNPIPDITLFSDNFEDGNTAGWTAHSGSWIVVTDSSMALAQKASATSLITAGEAWTDYSYEAKAKVPIANANAGITFRVQDTNHYYMFRINSTAKTLELYKAVDGILTSVSSTPFTATTNQWYTLKAVVQGNNIKAYVDGALKIEWTNPINELTNGKIGLRTTSVNALFDDIVVKGDH